MLKKLLPLVFLVVGTGAGIGAGIIMAPSPEGAIHAEGAGDGHGASTAEPAAKKKDGDQGDGHDDGHENDSSEYIKLNNQFVIPVVQNDKVASLVVVSLSLETEFGLREKVYEREPKLRDAFLQVLFDHANMGGFDGAFTRPEMLDPLREALLHVAHSEVSEKVMSVLIVDIARQDN